MKSNILIAIGAAAVFCLQSCNSNQKTTSKNSETADKTTRSKFLDPSFMDTTVKAGDNFWLYANGAWNKTVVIEPTESGVGAFNDLRKHNREVMKNLCEAASNSKAAAGTVEQKVGDLYASGMDTAAIEQLGYQPLTPVLNEINALADNKAVFAFINKHHAMGDGTLFNFYVAPDDKNAAINTCIFSQSGLGLPEKDYYFSKEAKIVEQRKAYSEYIAKLFQLTGDDAAKAATNAASVLALETKLAGGHFGNVELRDPNKNYHKMNKAGLKKLATNLDWDAAFVTLKITLDSFVVKQPTFVQTFGKALATEKVDSWKQYLRFHEISGASSLLSKEFDEAHFDFYSRTLSGQLAQKPRNERVALLVDGLFGEALGQLYVKQYFTDAAKKRMMDLVNNLQQTYSKRIAQLDWMSDVTKVKAQEKLATFIKKIGFPDKWKEYNIEVKRNDYFGNMMRSNQLENDRNLVKQGKPVDKTEWEMTPPTINAYYNPLFNEIVFPAGILQFPFFDLNADDAINYGGIGMVIGHEITHGFDDEGSQYDKDGNLKNWWTKEDETKFKAKTAAVSKQYSGFTVLDSVHVNGDLTLGENIADLGGVTIAFEAFKNTEQGKKNAKIDGFTAEQRFFLSLAQVWRMKNKDATILQRIKTDPHSPSMWRVNGPLENFPPFYAAFGVKEGDKMYKSEADRIKIW